MVTVPESLTQRWIECFTLAPDSILSATTPDD